MSNKLETTGQVILSNDSLLALCEKYLVVHCKVLRDLLDFHPFSFVPFIRMTVEFVLHYLFKPENQVLLFDSFVVQSLNLVKGIVLCAEYRPAKVIEGMLTYLIVAHLAVTSYRLYVQILRNLPLLKPTVSSQKFLRPTHSL